LPSGNKSIAGKWTENTPAVMKKSLHGKSLQEGFRWGSSDYVRTHQKNPQPTAVARVHQDGGNHIGRHSARQDNIS